MHLALYVIKRLLLAVPTFFFIIILIFVMIRVAPGDPAVFLAGSRGEVDLELVEKIRAKYGFDRPIYEQLVIYFGNIFSGDFGDSFIENRPALIVVMERLPATLVLILPTLIVSIVFGIAIGIYVGRGYFSKKGQIILGVSHLLFSTPLIVLGPILMLIFGIYLRIFPTSGMTTMYTGGTTLVYILNVLYHTFLPLLTISLGFYIPQLIQISAATIAEVERQDFVVTYRAIGLDERRLFNRHVFKNSLFPIVTLAGVWISYAVTGAVFTETIFGWPGIGRLMYESILTRDYNVLTLIFILTAINVEVVMIIIDVLYAIIDPRVRY